MTFLLFDPGWCVHKSDVQNKCNDNTRTTFTVDVTWNIIAIHKWTSADAVPLLHVPPNSGTALGQFLESKSVRLPHKVSSDLFL